MEWVQFFVGPRDGSIMGWLVPDAPCSAAQQLHLKTCHRVTFRLAMCRLDSRKWAEVRKWAVSFSTSDVHSNSGKGKLKKIIFSFLFSLLHNHFLISKVLQLIF